MKTDILNLSSTKTNFIIMERLWFSLKNLRGMNRKKYQKRSVDYKIMVKDTSR